MPHFLGDDAVTEIPKCPVCGHAVERFFLDSAGTDTWKWDGEHYVVDEKNAAYEQGLPEHNCAECPSYCGAGLEEVEKLLKGA